MKNITNTVKQIFAYYIFIVLWSMQKAIALLAHPSIFKEVNIAKGDIEDKIIKDGISRSIKYIFMPTRMGAAIVKNKDPKYFSMYIKNITKYNLKLVVILVGLLFIIDLIILFFENGSGNLFNFFLSQDFFLLHGFTYITLSIMIIGGSSRILEIFYAFYNDAKTHLQEKQSTNLEYFDRVGLAMNSYLELTLWFGVLYYVLSIFCTTSSFLGTAFTNGKLLTISDAIYFSGVTITTLGYGDISPYNFITKFLVVFEVFSGFILIIVSFTIYVSRAIREMDIEDRKKKEENELQ